MHIFDYSFLDEGLLPAEIVNLTATITAFNAISDTRKESNKSIYTELEKIARVQSVKGSNAIEGIVTTDARIKQIVDGDSAPLNHDHLGPFSFGRYSCSKIEKLNQKIFLTKEKQYGSQSLPARTV